MTSLTLDNVAIHYGKDVVVPGFSVDVEDGDFLVLLGPSGCGKSTLLRSIAGLIEPAAGRILFDGVDVTNLDPKQRNIAFVFQSYALYPNLTVRQNIAFPLVIGRFTWFDYLPFVSVFASRRYGKRPEVQAKVAEVSTMLGLEPILDDRPKKLSGGQRQRVALARSLVRDPSMFLLDEPLSNLDAKLRSKLRTEIATLQRELGTTFVYVTHDQVEAMTMATKVVVMNKGEIQQAGTPEEVYHRPANVFVAQFIGAPAMNCIPADAFARLNPEATIGAEVGTVGVRPENIVIVENGSPSSIAGTVEVVEELGLEYVYGVRVDGLDEPLFVKSRSDRHFFRGDRASLLIPKAELHLFDLVGDRLDIPVPAI